MFTKKLGFGLMRLPLNDPADRHSVNMEELKRMVDTFLDKGFNYFDTAYVYANSEDSIKEALVKRHPRERYKLATKMPLLNLKEPGDQERIFNEQVARTGLDYFDAYLLHNIGVQNYKIAQQFGCFDFIKQKKKEGVIRQIGFSHHDSAELLDEILNAHPETDFVQLQINYLDWDNKSIQSGKCYEVAQKHHKPVIVMEPVKGGTLANVPEKAALLFKNHHPELSAAAWAIRYAASLDGVTGVLSGMSNMEQMLDNTGFMQDFKPLTDDERAVIANAISTIKESIAIPCTGCNYCVKDCPKNIAIPNFFALYNNVKLQPPLPFYIEGLYYSRFTETHSKASDCIKCKRCERACPQYLGIVNYLKDVTQIFEKK
ncbi:MAG: aldo/keto reductase [Clostridiales bacterium]|nr:aldo/keto reductase [Clostridiales bacterium]